jgi:hypothetical protein
MTHCFKTATLQYPCYDLSCLFCLVILVILNYFILYFFSNHFIFTIHICCVKYLIWVNFKYFTSFGTMTHSLKRLHLQYPCYDLSWPILFSYFGYFNYFILYFFSNHFVFTIHIYCVKYLIWVQNILPHLGQWLIALKLLHCSTLVMTYHDLFC